MIRRDWNITWFGIVTMLVLVGIFLRTIMLSTEYSRGLLVSLLGGAIIAASIYGERSDRIEPLLEPSSALLTAVGGIVIMAGFGMIFGSYYDTVFAGGGFFESINGLADIFGILPGLMGVFLFHGGAVLVGAGALFLFSDRIDGQNRVSGTTSLDLIFLVILVVIVAVLGVGDILFDVARSLLTGISIVAVLGALVSSGTGFDGLIAGILLILTYFIGARAWRRLPIASLVPRRYKDRYDRLAGYERYMRYGIVPLLGLVLIVDGIVGISMYPFILGLLQSSGLREIMIEILLVSIGALIFVRVIRTFTRLRELTKRYGTYLVYLVLLYLLSTPLGIVLESFLNVMAQADFEGAGAIHDGGAAIVEFMGGHDVVALGILALILVSGISIKAGLRIFEVYGFVPPGLDGTAFISLAVFLWAIAFGLREQTALLLIGTALTLILWELGKRTTELGREIGPAGSALQSQTVFLAGSLLLGALGVVVGTQLLTLFEQTTITQPASVSAILALFVFSGIALLVIALRTQLQD